MKHPAEDELLHLLIDSITDYAIFSLDPNGLIISWSPAAEKLKGYSAEEIIGQPFSRFYTEEERALGKPFHLLQRSLAEGRVEDEGWRVRKDASKFWAWVVISPMYDGSGKLKGFAKITRDITERKQAEESRIRLAQMQEAARVRDEFLAYISHEMRTPLASLHLQLELLRQNLGSEARTSRTVERIGRAYERLIALVESVLQQSKIQTGRIFPRPIMVELTPTVADVVEEFRPEAERKSLRLVFTSEVQSGSSLKTDSDFLRIILVNLISNAVKFTEHGTIEVSISSSDAEYHICVRDEGLGIAVEDQRRIFEPFERVESKENKHTAGFGLGLATSKRLSEALGARIELQSQLGFGSSFTLVLPSEISG